MVIIKYLIEHLVRKFLVNLAYTSNSSHVQLIIEAQKTSAHFIKTLVEQSNKIPFLFSDRLNMHNFVIETLKQEKYKAKNLTVLEFGVYKGKSGKYFSSKLKDLIFYGFDSFEGLPEVFSGIDSYSKFKLGGKAPKKMPKNYKIIKGLVQETLNPFLLQNKDLNIIFIHLDLDVYDSTKFVLNSIKNKISKNTYILFDELIGNPFWQLTEFKALDEVFNRNEYDFIAFGPNQGLIKIK